MTIPTEARGEDFDAFYRAQYAPVVRLAWALTGRRSVAEEIAQDTFLAAHLAWDRVSNYESPAGWVRRIASNRCISTGRRFTTEARLLTRLRRERPQEPELDELTGAVWSEVRSLPRRQAQVVALTYLEDRNVDDVAEILGCGPETVRTHLRRARSTLARNLATPTTSLEEDDHV